MDKFLQEPIAILKKIQAVIQNIGINEFKKYSRNDLTEFQKQLRTYSNYSNILVELGKIIEEKKFEEYPQLLGVHHYPIIDEIEFLSTDEKIKLDDYLSKLRPNHSYILIGSSAWNNIFDSNKHKKDVYEVSKSIFEFLESKGIIRKMYRSRCVNCHESMDIYTAEEIAEYLEFFNLMDYEKSERFKELSSEQQCEISDKTDKLFEKINTEWCCMECEEYMDADKEVIKNIINDEYNHVYKLIKERDKSLDNI